ncbi:hypothetical protein COT78_00160 [Candidatus Berkelbacteria bacterium CG10_big_fil_rev_8_21_14_0_10_43_13]|uniref:DUF721 domain-containing protein n=1 Tax=Candidatus Berkelbacteria bacterium CG10_big_fil_rev_8_21_14_0_10_43_13 TaxID=1974514 RepID=A0A2H0W7P2_9BACT|nr:MAG: hypothetical protein COT78_00160 [Candidatus Berkelbacteria bacterium CG10_big_fil_rev_8_21_14_0_10_43_13]
MEKLDKILMSALAKKKLSGTIRSAQICFYANEWGKGRFEAVSFLRGVLKVSVNSSPAASELEIQKEELIDSVNKRLGQNSVRSVRIMVKW